jgi:DNA-binding NtrC family response regulator
LDREVEQNRFREDLFYRLCVVNIKLPPLRERKTDIPAIAQAFCKRYSLAYRNESLKLSKSTLKVMLEYDWPGNVRQLRNTIERAVVLTEGDEITLEVLPEEVTEREPQRHNTIQVTEENETSNITNFKEAKREFEKKHIEKCLDKTAGNITQAAALLGMHRQSLQHKIKELGLTKKFLALE